MDQDSWNELIVENRVTPRTISEDAFREWLSGRLVFVSSVMDAEMTPARNAVRSKLRELEATPIMWEELAPRDQKSGDAYIDGVTRSNLFVLLLGHSYGESDDSGYSPTHKESNRAQEQNIYRMLFQPNGISSSERDGELNHWMAELYNEVSGAKYDSPEDLACQLERRLREIASAQETTWVKIDNLIFPATTRLRSYQGQNKITIVGRVRNPGLKRSLSELEAGRRGLILTYGTMSRHINLESVEVDVATASESIVTIECSTDMRSQVLSHNGILGVTINSNGRSITPEDQARTWLRNTVFGESSDQSENGVMNHFMPRVSHTLPEVLRSIAASGWVAEGVAGVFIVEQLSIQLGARVDRIDIYPATSAGLRVNISYELQGYQQPLNSTTGMIPLT